MRTFNLFISHSWTYGKTYEGLVDLLKARRYFSYRDFSVPRNDPIHTNGTDRQLYNAIKNKVQLSSVVLIVAGVYATYSKWIDKEIYIAQHEFYTPKPIIAIEPWGSERTSAKVKGVANRVVRWNTDSIVDAIREVV